MANPRDFQMRGQQAGVQSGAVIDEGLRSYMLRGYNLMAMGLAITGVAEPAEMGCHACTARHGVFSELSHQ